MMDRNFEDFANAIVVQAARDYREAAKILKRNPRNSAAEYTKMEVERFFFSSWYKVLTNLDPEFLLEKLKEEIHNEN